MCAFRVALLVSIFSAVAATADTAEDDASAFLQTRLDDKIMLGKNTLDDEKPDLRLQLAAKSAESKAKSLKAKESEAELRARIAKMTKHYDEIKAQSGAVKTSMEQLAVKIETLGHEIGEEKTKISSAQRDEQDLRKSAEELDKQAAEEQTKADAIKASKEESQTRLEQLVKQIAHTKAEVKASKETEENTRMVLKAFELQHRLGVTQLSAVAQKPEETVVSPGSDADMVDIPGVGRMSRGEVVLAQQEEIGAEVEKKTEQTEEEETEGNEAGEEKSGGLRAAVGVVALLLPCLYL